MKPLIVFISLAYLISWSIWFPLYAYALGFPEMRTFRFQHAIGALGPMIAAILTTWIYSKNIGVKLLLKKYCKIKPLIYFIIALVSPFVLFLIASGISWLTDKKTINTSGLFSTNEFLNFNPFAFFIYNLIFFGFGEEAGWRGFALPRLQTKLSALSASVALTAFWALWHLPLFLFRPGYIDMNLAGASGWILSLLTGSILLTWLYNSTHGSILICAVFHSTVDITFTSDIYDRNVVNYMGILITFWAIAIIIFFKPQRLSLKAERTVY